MCNFRMNFYQIMERGAQLWNKVKVTKYRAPRVFGDRVDFQGGNPTIYILASGYFLFPHFCSHQINWLGLQRPTIANKRGKCVKKFIPFIPPTTSSRNRKQRSVIHKSIFLKLKNIMCKNISNNNHGLVQTSWRTWRCTARVTACGTSAARGSAARPRRQSRTGGSSAARAR